MKKLLGSAALSLCLLTPVATVSAQDHRDARTHEWNDGENNAWHQYLKDHHKKDHDWAKAKKREQEAYWKWRDQHRDNH